MDLIDLLLALAEGLQAADRQRSRERVTLRGTRLTSLPSGAANGTGTSVATRRPMGQPTMVKRSQAPYWREQGWQESPSAFKGFYRTPCGEFRGEIKKGFGHNHEYYIVNPPSELRRHPHWVCFLHRGNGRYLLHFSRRPKDVDSGIMAMERMIRESFERYGR